MMNCSLLSSAFLGKKRAITLTQLLLLLFFQEADSAGVSYPVHITMLCYFNRQLQGNVIVTDPVVTDEHLLMFLFCHAPVGSLKRHICCKQPHLWHKLVLWAPRVRDCVCSGVIIHWVLVVDRERKAPPVISFTQSLQIYLSTVHPRIFSSSCTEENFGTS